MVWRVAESILTLRREIDAAYPGRSTVSDGTIGDAAHATRNSDHNPFIIDDRGVGVVRAFDITHDPDSGCDANNLADRFRDLGEAGDPRIRYVIWNQLIYTPSVSPAWRPYSGSNPHTRHIHLSVSFEQRHYDSPKPWGIAEELTVADVEELLNVIRQQGKATRSTIRTQGKTTRRLLEQVDRLDELAAAIDALDAQIPNNLRAITAEIRRNLRDVALAAGVDEADIEGDPHADDPKT